MIKRGSFALVLTALAVNTMATSDRLVDVGFVVDASGSFGDDISTFQVEAANIIAAVTAAYPNAHFGLATFQDYPLGDWGDSGDVPHNLIRDIGPPDAAFTAALNGVELGSGGDEPESQLVSLYQCITGEGQVVPPAIPTEDDAGYTIPVGLNFNFRASSARILVLWTDAVFHTPGNTPSYPGPTVAQVIAAATSLNRRRLFRGGEGHRSLQEGLGPDVPRIVGIVSDSSSEVLDAIGELSIATGAVAGVGGIDCDGNGDIDVAEGDPIICPVANGLTKAITSVIDEIVPAIPDPVKTCNILTLILQILLGWLGFFFCDT